MIWGIPDKNTELETHAQALYQERNLAVITIANPNPPDGGKRGSLNPELSVYVCHSAGKPMDITFGANHRGEWKEIMTFSAVGDGTYGARSRDMIKRGRSYEWEVTATDGSERVTQRFTLELVYFFGDSRTRILMSDCWKYGFLKRGKEKGKFYATVQRGMWASYDLDRGWDRTFQRLFWDQGAPPPEDCGPNEHLDDGGNLGHPFWGYWDGKYRALGIDVNRWKAVASETFEGFQDLTEMEAATWDMSGPQQSHWPEGSAYTFSEDRAWIMAVDYDEPNSRSNVKYWEWTKQGGWHEPVTVGSFKEPHTGRVALLRHNRSTWYVYVTEGESSTATQETSATLKYFKSTDGGKTWGPLQDTGLEAHGLWSSVSFGRYGDNYYVILSKDCNTMIYYSQDGENWAEWQKELKRVVAPGMWMRPHGTLLHQSALILTVCPSARYVEEQYGVIALVPEMISHPGKPTDPCPACGDRVKEAASEVELAVTVHGPQTYDVAFYWADGTFIGEDKLLQEGDIARVSVSGLSAGKHEWYVVARGALFEYCGAEPDTASDEQWSDVCGFTVGD